MKRIQIVLLLLIFFEGLLTSSVTWACNNPEDGPLQSLLKAKNYEQAASLAQSRIKAHPDDPRSHLALASVYLRQAFQEGIHINTEALGLKPGESGTAKITPENLEQVFQSRIQIVPEYADKAAAVLEKVVQRWPDQRQAHFCLLDLYQKSADHKKFLKTTDRVAKTFGKEGAPLVEELLPYAVFYFKKNQLNLAGDFYEVLLKHFPQSEKVLSSFGVIRLKLGNLDEGVTYFMRAHRIQPKDPLILCNIGEGSIYQQKFEQARKFLQLCARQKPKRIAIYFDLAILAMAENPENSIPAWELYLKKNETTPDHPDWVLLGRQTLEKAKSGITREEAIHLADRFIKARGSKLAIPLIAWLVKQDSEEPLYPYRLSQAYDLEGFYLQAYQHAIRTEQLLLKHPELKRPKITHVRFELGRLAYALQKWDESASFLEKVMADNPKAPNLQYLLGLTELERGNKDAARKYFQDCLDQPNNAQYATYCRKSVNSL